MRVVQFTPPGSACAIVFGTGMGPLTDMVPGSVKGLHLVVRDIDEARAALAQRGAQLSDVQDLGGVKYSWFSYIRRQPVGAAAVAGELRRLREHLMTAAIEGKVVVITGASSGLGEATARHLCAEGRQSCSAPGASSASRRWPPN